MAKTHIFDGPAIARKLRNRKLRKTYGPFAILVLLLGCAFAYQEISAHSSHLSTDEALLIVQRTGDRETLRRQAHLVLDKLVRQSRDALAKDAARTGPMGRDATNRIKIGCMMGIQKLRELEKLKGEVGSSAHAALQSIAREAHDL